MTLLDLDEDEKKQIILRAQQKDKDYQAEFLERVRAGKANPDDFIPSNFEAQAKEKYPGIWDKITDKEKNDFNKKSYFEAVAKSGAIAKEKARKRARTLRQKEIDKSFSLKSLTKEIIQQEWEKSKKIIKLFTSPKSEKISKEEYNNLSPKEQIKALDKGAYKAPSTEKNNHSHKKKIKR